MRRPHIARTAAIIVAVSATTAGCGEELAPLRAELAPPVAEYDACRGAAERRATDVAGRTTDVAAIVIDAREAVPCRIASPPARQPASPAVTASAATPVADDGDGNGDGDERGRGWIMLAFALAVAATIAGRRVGGPPA